MTTLETIEATTGAEPRAAVIWLHGLGADGNDFAFMPKLLGPHLPQPTRFVFPHAPVRPVTLNGGHPMRAWFDLTSLDRNTEVDEAELADIEAQVTALIDKEIERGIPSNQIIIGGFSQGAALALLVGLQHQPKLAGVAALSTFLTDQAISELQQRELAKPPIFQAHGTSDDVLPFELGRRAHEALLKLDYAVEWHEYAMAHSVNEEEIADLVRWLSKTLA